MPLRFPPHARVRLPEMRTPRAAVLAALITASVAPTIAHAQLECDGQWNPSSATWNPSVSALAILPDGDVVVGGRFTIAEGAPADYIGRWNPITDTTGSLGAGFNNEVRALLALPDGDVIAGGDFTMAGGVTALRIARWNSATQTWSPMGPGLPGDVLALCRLPNGDVIAGGGFPVSRWDAAHETWISLGRLDYQGAPGAGHARALTVLPDQTFIVGGHFDAAAGVPANGVAQYHPATNSWSALGLGVGGVQYPFVHALTTMLDGRVAVGGHFASAGDTPTGPAAIWDPAEGRWTKPGGGINFTLSNSVYGLTTLKNGDVVAGGMFGGVAGVPMYNLARWNPALGVWSEPWDGPSASHVIHTLAVLPVFGREDLLVGGEHFLSRWVVPGPGAITITVQPSPATTCPTGSAIYHLAVGAGVGPFTYQWQIMEEDGFFRDLSPDPITLACGATALATDAGADQFSITIRPCPGPGVPDVQQFYLRAVVTGARCTATSYETSYTICPADISCNGSVSVQDLFDFLTAYFSLDPRADFNGQGGISVEDIFDFLAAYFAGCP